MIKKLLGDLMIIAGLASVGFGLYEINPCLAYIVIGAIITALGWALTRG